MVSEMRQYRSHMKNRRFQLHQYSGFGSVLHFCGRLPRLLLTILGSSRRILLVSGTVCCLLMQNIDEFVHTYLVVYLSLVGVLLIVCGGYVKKHDRMQRMEDSSIRG